MMKKKAILTILISIIIGFILGFITSSQISFHRVKDVSSLSSKHKFEERTYEILNLSEKQHRNIEPIVSRYASMADSLKKVSYLEFKSLIDRFHSELNPYLLPEQVRRLNDFPKHLHHNKEPDRETKK